MQRYKQSGSVKTAYTVECKQIMSYLYVQPSSWRWTLGFESCRRHRKNYNSSLTKMHFVGLCHAIVLYCTGAKNIKMW